MAALRNSRLSSKAPSFAEFTASSPLASRIKGQNRATHTRPEILLRRALFRQGARYRLHARDLPGKPDIVFRPSRVVVFVDGDFWHGRHWRLRKQRLLRGSNARYWIEKIGSNRLRDRIHSAALRRLQWRVLRVWESDVKKDAEGCAALILKAVREGRRNQ